MASYPGSAKVFTTKSDGPGNTILAAHINDLQSEVTAVEQDLIAGLPVARGGLGLTAVGAAGTVPVSNGSALAYGSAGDPYPAHGRLTLTTAVPITVSDVTAATTLYYALYKGNQIALYNGSTGWTSVTFAELSIAVPATTNQMYDVFIYNNAGTATLELTAWTNDTTRATALTTQNGVLVKTGATTRRYVGSFRTTGVSGQTEDSAAKRYVWNYYHRVARRLEVIEATTSWAYTTNTWRQARATATNQVDAVIGVAEVWIDLTVSASFANAGAVNCAVAIGLDSTTAPAGNQVITVGIGGVGSGAGASNARYVAYPSVGRHYFAWLENSTAVGATTWYSAAAAALAVSNQSGIIGSIDG